MARTTRDRNENSSGNRGNDEGTDTLVINGTKKGEYLFASSPENEIVMNGFGGQDTLTGYGKKVTLNGGDGGDWLEGHAPPNADKTASVTLIGGAGNDTLTGGDDSTLLGGMGSDRFRFAPDWYNGNAPATYKTDFNQKQGDIVDLTGYGTWVEQTPNNWVFVPMDDGRLIEKNGWIYVDREDGTYDDIGVRLIGISGDDAIANGVIQLDWGFGKG